MRNFKEIVSKLSDYDMGMLDGISELAAELKANNLISGRTAKHIEKYYDNKLNAMLSEQGRDVSDKGGAE